MRSSVGLLAAALALAGLLLTGCGDYAETTGTGTEYGQTGSGIPNAGYSNPSYGSPTTGTPYGTPTQYGCGQGATSGQPAGGQTAYPGTTPGGQTAYPGTTTGTDPYGCTTTATPAPGASAGPVRSGLEASITERHEQGIFKKALKSVTVAVANHDAVARDRFLLVIFTKKEREVDVQYKRLVLSPGASLTFDFETDKEADDAKVELRETLL